MNKAFYLSTCTTCKRILEEVNLPKNIDLQDIKTNNISREQLEEMRELAGSYESLFSRRAMKFRSMGLNELELTEEDYKRLILEEYTFLKRPVFVLQNDIYIGSSKKEVEALKEKLSSSH